MSVFDSVIAVLPFNIHDAAVRYSPGFMSQPPASNQFYYKVTTSTPSLPLALGIFK